MSRAVLPSMAPRPSDPAEFEEWANAFKQKRPQWALYYRHKLQKAFMSGQPPRPVPTVQLPQMHDIFCRLENGEAYTTYDVAALSSSKLHKVMKAISRSSAEPSNAEYHFDTRAGKLYDLYTHLLSERECVALEEANLDFEPDEQVPVLSNDGTQADCAFRELASVSGEDSRRSLMDLPSEIRAEIYDLYLRSAEVWVEPSADRLSDPSSTASSPPTVAGGSYPGLQPPPLLLVNRTVHAEVEDSYLSRIQYSFHTVKDLLDTLSKTSPTSISKLRYLCVGNTPVSIQSPYMYDDIHVHLDHALSAFPSLRLDRLTVRWETLELFRLNELGRLAATHRWDNIHIQYVGATWETFPRATEEEERMLLENHRVVSDMYLHEHEHDFSRLTERDCDVQDVSNQVQCPTHILHVEREAEASESEELNVLSYIIKVALGPEATESGDYSWAMLRSCPRVRCSVGRSHDEKVISGGMEVA